MGQVGFYYEVSPLAKMAYDSKGNDIKAYMEVNIELEVYPKDSVYEQLQEKVKKVVSQQTNIAFEHLKSISKEEYDENHIVV